MELPAVYPILDTGLLARLNLPLIDAAEALVEGGARIVQLRHKADWTREAYHAATELASFLRAAQVDFIINDRADIAKLLGAGLHVGQLDMPPTESRAILDEAAILGYSTHNEAQFQAASAEPVDYLALGPIFPTGSKANPDPVVGLAELKRLALDNPAEPKRLALDNPAELEPLALDNPAERHPETPSEPRPSGSGREPVNHPRKPLVAIGGITLDTALDVWNAGAHSIALISDLFETPTKQAIRARLEAWLKQATIRKS